MVVQPNQNIKYLNYITKQVKTVLEMLEKKVVSPHKGNICGTPLHGMHHWIFVKHPLGRYLPVCSMWHAVFHTCTVEEFMHDPMHKNDTPWIVAQ